MRRRRRYTLAATLGFSVVAFVTGMFACRKNAAPVPAAEAKVDAPTPTDETPVDPRFCGKGLSPVPGGGCLSIPEGGGTFPLVVYLHGLHDDVTLPEELARQTRVAELGAKHRARFATIAFHGKKGDCTTQRIDTLYCWPSNERTAKDGPAVAATFARSIAEAEARGAKGKRYLLGFSNGGYFAMLVAQGNLLRFDAVTVAHGGPVPPTQRPASAPPLLLLTADSDAAIDEMMRLGNDLKGVAWPFTILSRDGAHGLPESDVALALDFFDRSSRGEALVPPPSSHPPSPVRRAFEDAGETVPLAGEEPAVAAPREAATAEAVGEPPPAEPAPTTPPAAPAPTPE